MAGFVKGSKEYIAYSVKRMRDIGRVHRLKDEGCSIEDIIIKTGLNGETVRNYLNIIARAEANRNKNK